MFRSSIVALALMLVRAAGADPCSAVAPKAGLGDLGSFIAQEMRKAKLPGLSIAIVQNGKMVCAEGFGLRDLQHKLPMETQAIFHRLMREP